MKVLSIVLVVYLCVSLGIKIIESVYRSCCENFRLYQIQLETVTNHFKLYHGFRKF